MKTKFALAAALLATLVLAAPTEPTVAFPKEYRRWVHSKSMVIPDKAHGLYGFHHVYVEPSALDSYKTGKGYPEGARLVVPFHEVKEGEGMTQQGPLKWVAVMQRDSSAKDTGGWRWASFDAKGASQTIDAKTACYTCHAPKKDRTFVFSEWVE